MWSFFTDGIQHITDPGGYDHMLFLVALCAPFNARQWKQIVFLATAFTLGHSITLALAAFDVIHFSSDLIELLIPVTILSTSVFNLINIRKNRDLIHPGNYAITAAFGLIHGMGFSSYLRMIMNDTSSTLKGLLAFNLGVEMGQIIIIFIFLILSIPLRKLFSPERAFVMVISFFTGIVACYLILMKLIA